MTVCFITSCVSPLTKLPDGRVQRRQSQVLLMGTQLKDRDGQGKFFPDRRNSFWTRAWSDFAAVFQSGWQTSLLADIQSSSVRAPEQPDLLGPLWLGALSGDKKLFCSSWILNGLGTRNLEKEYRGSIIATYQYGHEAVHRTTTGSRYWHNCGRKTVQGDFSIALPEV